MRDIVDSITSTVGTMFNWKMMGKVIEEVGKLERFVDHHDAGDYDLGRSYGMLHMLNWSNCSKNFMVNVYYYLFIIHHNNALHI